MASGEGPALGVPRLRSLRRLHSGEAGALNGPRRAGRDEVEACMSSDMFEESRLRGTNGVGGGRAGGVGLFGLL